MRIMLNSINADKMNKKVRLYNIWCAFLWLSAIDGINITTLRNLSSAVFGVIWLVLQSDCRSLRLIGTEPLEHKFGHWRGEYAEFSALQVLSINQKIEKIFDLCFESNLAVGRKGKGKGYSAGFENLRQAIQKMMNTRNASHHSSSQSFDPSFAGIKMDYDHPAVGQLEKEVFAIINRATADVEVLFSNP